MRILLAAAASLLLALAPARAAPAPEAMPANPAAARADWWKQGVIYEIYPRSFADSNNDGQGDIPGITAHLDYLAALGVDAVWMTPMFPSPQVDFGYDVADYNGVDPSYGTLADMDRLIAAGRARGVKLILDFVINHSSDQHPWFVAARSGRTDPHRDWYVWRDAKVGGGVPNNWTSYFGGPAWKWDAKTGQYYYHIFAPQQPDLNWRNPKVETAMFAAAEWWLKRGVYGYRLDAVDAMFERADLADEPQKPGTDAFGMPNQSNINKANQPETHTELQRLRAQVIDRYPGRVLIGETYPTDTADLVRHYGPSNNEIQLPMYLSLIGDQPLQATDLRARIAAVEANPVDGWPCFALGNHDKTRVASRLSLPEGAAATGATADDMAKLTGALLLTVRGTPVLYYGEELGMVNTDPTRREDVRDRVALAGWPREKGRDGERTPMQWDASTNAGFNRGTRPWLPIAADYATRNVVAETADPHSVLSLYRTLIAARRTNPALAGDYATVAADNAQVLGFTRSGGGKTVLVLLNFDGHAADVPLARAGGGRLGRIIAANRAVAGEGAVHLDALGVFVAEVER